MSDTLPSASELLPDGEPPLPMGVCLCGGRVFVPSPTDGVVRCAACGCKRGEDAPRTVEVDGFYYEFEKSDGTAGAGFHQATESWSFSLFEAWFVEERAPRDPGDRLIKVARTTVRVGPPGNAGKESVR